MTTRTPSSLHSMARGLGWFSIGLGAAELLAPRLLGRALGMRRATTLLRAYGAREVAAGVGILTSGKNPAPWVWGRVAGDALDMATLLGNAARPGQRSGNTVALVAVAGVTLLDVLCAKALSEQKQRAAEAVDYSDRSGWPNGAPAAQGAAAASSDSASLGAEPMLTSPTTTTPRPLEVVG